MGVVTASHNILEGVSRLCGLYYIYIFIYIYICIFVTRPAGKIMAKIQAAYTKR